MKINFKTQFLLQLYERHDCFTGVERPNNCPPEYVLVGGKCYYISTSGETYMNAITECQIKNGRLFEPRDAETYLILVRYLEVTFYI